MLSQIGNSAHQIGVAPTYRKGLVGASELEKLEATDGHGDQVTLRNAALLFSAGWAMFWASALGLIAFVPLWLALAILICGLGMIPLATRKAKSQASAAPDASTIAAAVER